jgi:hypothetical protein
MESGAGDESRCGHLPMQVLHSPCSADFGAPGEDKRRHGTAQVQCTRFPIGTWQGRTKDSAVLLANPPGVIRSGELLSAESQRGLPLPFAVQMDLTLVTKEATS